MLSRLPSRFFLTLAAASLLSAAAGRAQAPPVVCAKPDAKAARRAFEKGLEREQAEDWAAAFEAYGQAVACGPRDRQALLRREAVRFRLVEQHTERAERAAVAGRLDQATEELRAALRIDPGYSVARERLEQFQDQAVTPAHAAPTPVAGAPQLQPQSGTRDFDQRGDVRAAYDGVARAFGLFAAFDPDLPARNIRFRVPGVDFPTAMALLAKQTNTFSKPLDAHTFFVAQNTPEKRRQYAPVVVRTILLPGSTTSEQMSETLRLVREIAGVSRTDLDTRSRTITLRDTPEAVALAAALVQEVEQARGELLLEIEILEVDRNLARRLGVTAPSVSRLITVSPAEVRALEAAPDTATLLSIIQQIFGTPANLSGLTAAEIAALLAAGQVSLATLVPPFIAVGGGKTVALLNLPGAAADFSETFSLVRSGRRMLLRAEDGKPATFFVGERFPITVATLSASFLSTLAIPANRQGLLQAPFPAFQYEDLGLKVRATPRLHLDGEVTLQMEFEIRSLSGVSINGVPIISNRNVEQAVRLHENETTILSGIVQRDEAKTITGLPGFARATGVGHLAGRRDTQRQETELLIVVTPRQLRLAPRADRAIYVGMGERPAITPAPQVPPP